MASKKHTPKDYIIASQMTGTPFRSDSLREYGSETNPKVRIWIKWFQLVWFSLATQAQAQPFHIDVSLHLHFLFCFYHCPKLFYARAMNADLQTVRDFYDSTWLDMPFTNILNLEALFLAMEDPGVVSAFLDGDLPSSELGSFLGVAKDTLHLSEEGGTCGPFAIITGEKLDHSEWRRHYLHTGRHGGMVVWKAQSPTKRYIIDSSLRTAYEIPLSGFLWSPGHHIYSTDLVPPQSLNHSSPILHFLPSSAIHYTEKGSNVAKEFKIVPRRELICRPIDALVRDAHPVLLIRHRVGNVNRFAVSINFNLDTRGVRFVGRAVNEFFPLTSGDGLTDWRQFALFQRLLHHYHELYPRQLSQGLFRRFTHVVLTRLLLNGLST
jgi:hypothetical protein